MVKKVLRNTILGDIEAVDDNVGSSFTGNVIDWSAGTLFYITVDDDQVFTFSNDGVDKSIDVVIKATTTAMLTFPEDVIWMPAGKTPDIVIAGKSSIVSFKRVDGQIYGSVKEESGENENSVAITDTEIDWSLGNVFYRGTIANVTFTFANLSDKQIILAVKVTGGSNRTMTFPAEVRWEAGSAPGALVNNTSTVFNFRRITGDVYAAGEIFGSFTLGHPIS